MSLRAGSFISGASTELKQYSEFETETSDYILKRVITGSRIFIEIVIKSNASTFENLELIPRGAYKHFYYDKMIISTQLLTNNPTGNSGVVTFSELVRDETSERIALLDGQSEYSYAWSDAFDRDSDPSDPKVESTGLPHIQFDGLRVNYEADAIPHVGQIGVITLEGTVTGIYDG